MDKGVVARADPDGAGELRRVAAPPQVAPIVGRAGLAGDDLASREGGGMRGAVALVYDAFEHLRHRIGDIARDDLLAISSVGVVHENVAVPVDHLHDAGRLMMDAVGCQRSVGARHLGGVRLARAERDGRIGLQGGAGQPHGGRHVDDGLGRDAAFPGDQPDIAGVRRTCGHVGDAERAVVVVSEVVDGRSADRDGAVAVDEGLVRVDSLVDGGRQGEHLEGRSRLPSFGARGDIELVFGIIAAADHGLDESRMGIDAGERDLLSIKHRTGVVFVLDGLLGVLLHLGVDGRSDRQAALEHHVGAVLLLKGVADVACEPGVLVDAVAAAGLFDVEIEVLGGGVVVFILRYIPVGQHARKHEVAALQRVVGILDGVVERRGVRNADKGRGLRERQVGGIDGIIMLRGRLDAVAPVAVVDGVEIHHQDLVFVVDLLELYGQLHLAHLALDRDVVHL